jgi:N-acetylneuraminate synthase
LELKELFGSEVVSIGYSDHVPSREASDDQLIVARTLGARVFERHFTYDQNLPGNDHYHSLDVDSLRLVISRLKAVGAALSPADEEKLMVVQAAAREQARRSIVFARDMMAGEIIAEGDIVCKRPGTGVSAANFYSMIGRRLTRDFIRDEMLEEEGVTSE